MSVISDGIKLGISPLSWANEVLLDYGVDTTAADCLAGAERSGYAGVEMSRLFPSDAATLKPLLDGYGLALVSGWHNGFLTERDVGAELAACAPVAELFAALGCDVLVYGECGAMPANALDVPMSRRIRLTPAQLVAYGQRMSVFAAALQERYGLKLVYHHHLMMVIETFSELCDFVAATTPDVGLLLDTGHACAGGFSYEMIIERFSDRIRHVHIKDVRKSELEHARSSDLSFNDAVRAGMFTIPGDGMVDFAPLLTYLRSGRYKGWAVVEAEQDPQREAPEAVARRAHEFLVRAP